MKAAIKCLYSEVWPIEQFVPNPKNPNNHPDAQLEMLGKLILKAGWRNPIVVSARSGMVVKGHGRLAAAKRVGLTEAPVEIQDYASEAAELADLVADNRIAEMSERDQFTVHGVLSELKELDGMLEQTGFTDEDFKLIDSEIMAGMDAPAVRLPKARASGGDRKANTFFNAGPIRFEITREDYLRWHGQIRSAVGFEKKNILREIKARLGMKTQAIK